MIWLKEGITYSLIWVWKTILLYRKIGEQGIREWGMIEVRVDWRRGKSEASTSEEGEGQRRESNKWGWDRMKGKIVFHSLTTMDVNVEN